MQHSRVISNGFRLSAEWLRAKVDECERNARLATLPAAKDSLQNICARLGSG